MDTPPTPSLPILVTMLVALGGCHAAGEGPPTPPPPASTPQLGPIPPPRFAIWSKAFREGESLPRTFTCDGQNVSPPLTWEGTPWGTRSLALIVEDPDAPDGASFNWLVWGTPAASGELPEGVKPTGSMHEGTNSSGAIGWVGPCPIPGRPHRYRFRLYALNAALDLPSGATAHELRKAMRGDILAESVLTGRYIRPPQ
jgi:Raf kinase inhibitor-like YbhB/YbcL family protein